MGKILDEAALIEKGLEARASQDENIERHRQEAQRLKEQVDADAILGTIPQALAEARTKFRRGGGDSFYVMGLGSCRDLTELKGTAKIVYDALKAEGLECYIEIDMSGAWGANDMLRVRVK